MSRNDKGSLATAKLNIYRQLNETLRIHRQQAIEDSLCVPGCTECCYDYYAIQSVEFDLILNELEKWDEEELDGLIRKADKYWKILKEEHPEIRKLLLGTSNSYIEEINLTIDKTSFPCIFLNETTNLCEIYDVRPFKCRIFGNGYYYSEDEGAMGIVCQRYGSIINGDNFDDFLCDLTEIIDRNTDLSIIQDKKKNKTVVNPQYPLIYYLYKHFILNR